MLTLMRHILRMRLINFQPARASALIAVALCVLAGCSEQAQPPAGQGILATDPLVARALNDPLMVDPDLAYRNEANAAVTIRHDHALPPFIATDELANQAREAARTQLLEDGRIPGLPFPVVEQAPAELSSQKLAPEMLKAVGGPANCAQGLHEGLIWATDMPGPSQIMPHGLVQQAAGSDTAECTVRIVRYLTPVGQEDALQYHFALADRARLYTTYYEKPERVLVGDGRTEQLVIHTREGPGGMSAVDMIYWVK